MPRTASGPMTRWNGGGWSSDSAIPPGPFPCLILRRIKQCIPLVLELLPHLLQADMQLLPLLLLFLEELLELFAELLPDLFAVVLPGRVTK